MRITRHFLGSSCKVHTMRPESSLAPDGLAADLRRAWMSGRRRDDVVAVVLLIALPAVVFGVPALLGHAVLPGDDLTQNLPLRVLAGLGVLTFRYAPPGFATGLALSLMAGVLVTGFFVTVLFARRVRKPVHHPRSPVSNPARMLQDR
jgi:hypothetical protein